MKNEEFIATLEKMPMKPDFITSAKTGMNVENMFLGLAKSMFH